MSGLLSLLLGGWGLLRNLFNAAMGLLRTDPKTFAIIVLALATVWCWHGWSVADKRGDNWHSAYLSQEKTIKSKAQEAEAKAATARAAAEARSLEIAHAQDEKDALVDQLARSNRDAYAATHRLRPSQAVPCVPGGTAQTAVPVSAAQPDGAGAAADMVVVSRADFDQITDAAVRAAEAHDTAGQWIANGIALPEPAKPPETLLPP